MNKKLLASLLVLSTLAQNPMFAQKKGELENLTLEETIKLVLPKNVITAPEADTDSSVYADNRSGVSGYLSDLAESTYNTLKNNPYKTIAGLGTLGLATYFYNYGLTLPSFGGESNSNSECKHKLDECIAKERALDKEILRYETVDQKNTVGGWYDIKIIGKCNLDEKNCTIADYHNQTTILGTCKGRDCDEKICEIKLKKCNEEVDRNTSLLQIEKDRCSPYNDMAKNFEKLEASCNSKDTLKEYNECKQLFNQKKQEAVSELRNKEHCPEQAKELEKVGTNWKSKLNNFIKPLSYFKYSDSEKDIEDKKELTDKHNSSNETIAQPDKESKEKPKNNLKQLKQETEKKFAEPDKISKAQKQAQPKKNVQKSKAVTLWKRKGQSNNYTDMANGDTTCSSIKNIKVALNKKLTDNEKQNAIATLPAAIAPVKTLTSSLNIVQPTPTTSSKNQKNDIADNNQVQLYTLPNAHCRESEAKPQKEQTNWWTKIKAFANDVVERSDKLEQLAESN